MLESIAATVGLAPNIETAALMLGSDRSRGYCLEMIWADFLAGANLDNGDPETLLFSMTRFFKFLPGEGVRKPLTASLILSRDSVNNPVLGAPDSWSPLVATLT